MDLKTELKDLSDARGEQLFRPVDEAELAVVVGGSKGTCLLTAGVETNETDAITD